MSAGNGVAKEIAGQPVERTCECFGGRRRPPIRIHSQMVAWVLRQLPTLTTVAHVVILDYRCPTCHKLVELTVGDVFGIGRPVPEPAADLRDSATR